MFYLFNWAYLLVSAIVVVISWLISRKTYWSRKNINGPSNWLPFQELLSIRKKPFNELQYENYKKYNKVWGGHSGFNKFIVVGEPELIKNVLVKDFANFQSLTSNRSGNSVESKFLTQLKGAEWKRVRTIVATTFTSQKLKLIFQLMKICNKIGFAELRKISETSQKFDPKIFWGQYVIDIIAKCCFATDLNTFESPDNIFLTHCKNAFSFNLSRLVFFSLLPKKLLNYFKVSFMQQKSLSFFSQVVSHILKSREENPSLKVNDFIQLLADSQSEEILDDNENRDDHKKKLSKNEVIANCVIFILAGYETSSTLLSFASYELAKNSEFQDKLFEEVSQADIDDYQQLNELPYLDAVIKESLRLYPPAITLMRVCSKCKLGGSIPLDDRTIVQIPIFSIHRDPDNFENPDTFNPDRFLPPYVDKIKPYTYLPFGGGPRICVGMRFALVNAKLALATLIKNFRIYRTDETPLQPIFKPISFLLNPEPFLIGISSRS